MIKAKLFSAKDIMSFAASIDQKPRFGS